MNLSLQLVNNSETRFLSRPNITNIKIIFIFITFYSIYEVNRYNKLNDLYSSSSVKFMMKNICKFTHLTKCSLANLKLDLN